MKFVDATLIELLLAPAVLMPACALLAMSTSARLSAILARIRTLHAQRLASYVELDLGDGRAREVHAVRLEGLEVQSHSLLRRAGIVRVSLLLEYASIAALLASSVCLGVALLAPFAEYVAVGFFVVGLILLSSAVVAAMMDVWQAVRWVRYEHDRVGALAGGHGEIGENVERSSIS